MSQNSRVPSSWRVAGMSGVRGTADEALGGVGGFAGRKKAGSDATVDCLSLVCFLFFFALHTDVCLG